MGRKSHNQLSDHSKKKLWDALEALGKEKIGSHSSAELAECLQVQLGFEVTAKNVITACDVLGYRTQQQASRDATKACGDIAALMRRVERIERELGIE